MKPADAVAIAAVLLAQVIATMPSPPTVRKREEQLRVAALPPPSSSEPTGLRGTFNPAETFKALCKLPRPEAILLARIRSGHCPLNAYLHRLEASDIPNRDLCLQLGDVNHFLTTCQKSIGLRQEFYSAAAQALIAPNRAQLLTNPHIYKALATFSRQSCGFYQARYCRRSLSTRPHQADAKPLQRKKKLGRLTLPCYDTRQLTTCKLCYSNSH